MSIKLPVTRAWLQWISWIEFIIIWTLHWTKILDHEINPQIFCHPKSLKIHSQQKRPHHRSKKVLWNMGTEIWLIGCDKYCVFSLLLLPYYGVFNILHLVTFPTEWSYTFARVWAAQKTRGFFCLNDMKINIWIWWMTCVTRLQFFNWDQKIMSIVLRALSDRVAVQDRFQLLYKTTAYTYDVNLPAYRRCGHMWSFSVSETASVGC